MTRTLLPLLALALSCSCPNGDEPEPVAPVAEPPPPPERVSITRLRGVVTNGDQGLRFRACDAEQDLRVTGSAADEVREVHGRLSTDGGQASVYVEVVGAVRTEGAAGGMVAVESLQVALPEAGTPFCEYDASYLYKAQGNEPFWNATLTDGNLRFEALDGGEPVVLPATAARIHGSTGPAWRAEGEGRTIELKLIPERCWDGSSSPG